MEGTQGRKSSGQSEVGFSSAVGRSFEDWENSGRVLGKELVKGGNNYEIFGMDAQADENIEGSCSNKEVGDVQKRLQELLLSTQEPELSEEQLKINDQSQEDELLAMESIYGDDIFILDRLTGLRCFQIHVHTKTQREVSVSVNLSSPAVLKTQDDSEFSYSFKVEYLPPIILTCLLPRSYPSHCPPDFTISVQWLDSSKISALCHMLDTVWNQQSGQEVIYQWVEWLHSSCRPFLDFDQEITLGPYGGFHDGDRRAISGSVSPEVDISSIKSYNNKQCHENFSKSLHECCICFSEFIGTEFARLPCQHYFCWTCMKTYSNMHVKEGAVIRLVCPSAKCGGMIPPCLLRQLISDEEYKLWESMTLRKALESMSDVTCCPRCEIACIEDEDQHALCSKCFFSFCTLCSQRWHVGPCMTVEERLAVLKERQDSCHLEREQKRREQNMINELLNVRAIKSSAKQCPSCKMAISRIEGCNKMVCGNCGGFFCYRCNSRIGGYSHFRDGQCELYN